MRVGVPGHGIGGRAGARLTEGGFAGVIQSPKFATGVGLVLYGASHEPMAAAVEAMARSERPGIGKRFASWVREMF